MKKNKTEIEVLKQELRKSTLENLFSLLKKEIKVSNKECFLRIFPNVLYRENIWSVCYVDSSEDILTRCDNVDIKEAVIDAITKY